MQEVHTAWIAILITVETSKHPNSPVGPGAIAILPIHFYNFQPLFSFCSKASMVSNKHVSYEVNERPRSSAMEVSTLEMGRGSGLAFSSEGRRDLSSGRFSAIS